MSDQRTTTAGRKHIRVAVAQTTLVEDPRDAGRLRAAGEQVRKLMREAARDGARLVLFPEGAMCAPNKRIVSSLPDEVGPADWSRFAWDVLREELSAVAELAGELRLWTVLGSVHRLTPPNRPHNSLYVISDRGEVAGRYDERLLSKTKVTYMYAPGTATVTFDVDGVRFGCLLGMEVHYPELFAAYEQQGVDCVLFATTGSTPAEQSPTFATEAQGLAAVNGMWVAFAGSAAVGSATPSGLLGPDGTWSARCEPSTAAAVVVGEIDDGAAEVEIAVRYARPWRREARSGLYEEHRVVADPRSEARSRF
ncbi:Nitrilase/cyanide hydratase and apolipoprotein N- acyltransferase [Catenulispora acidiphila DSM 44928]|uniref:Nitrilase/cyanide hydratase and apolipoprotein N-acyltransferase n=1 Tax=Catenulispora acidiphila (strain DSM 44928 / JCM 14897 / NBRC 102108 / NRRL B-24433 / ID139908) TaxID=479433 RepID=C7PYY6_CATAD|nr:Nitrilase/cyanide hydratase and apolipoprotein N- acyltransferase [Catenulispora acidiphila DSM 44928]